MKILLIGNADSVFVKAAIEHTLPNGNNTVSILSPNNLQYREFYQQNNIHVYKELKRGKIPVLRWIIPCIKEVEMLRKEQFDVIQIHFVTVQSLFRNYLLKRGSMKTIASFWGSDIFRISPMCGQINKLLLRKVDAITLLTPKMKQKFWDFCGHKYDSRLYDVKFGISEFENISMVKKYDSKKIKKAMNLPLDKAIFSIGYNGIREQQHLEVLEQIEKLPDSIQEKMHIILRLTYGKAPEGYLEKIHEVLKKLKCSSCCYTEFMTEEQIAMLEASTDVFIHAQTTDAFSATIQEHIFAGALLINPTWIDYQEMKDADIFYLEYSKFEQLTQIIIDYFDGYKYEEERKGNPQKIYQISSWKSVSPKWNKVYDEIE